MTVLALFPILAFVSPLTVVVLAVAGVAILRRLLVIAVFVAIGTLGINVLSRQYKMRRVVVKLCFLPQIFVVAISTLGTQ